MAGVEQAPSMRPAASIAAAIRRLCDEVLVMVVLVRMRSDEYNGTSFPVGVDPVGPCADVTPGRNVPGRQNYSGAGGSC